MTEDDKFDTKQFCYTTALYVGSQMTFLGAGYVLPVAGVGYAVANGFKSALVNLGERDIKHEIAVLELFEKNGHTEYCVADLPRETLDCTPISSLKAVQQEKLDKLRQDQEWLSPYGMGGIAMGFIASMITYQIVDRLYNGTRIADFLDNLDGKERFQKAGGYLAKKERQLTAGIRNLFKKQPS